MRSSGCRQRGGGKPLRLSIRTIPSCAGGWSFRDRSTIWLIWAIWVIWASRVVGTIWIAVTPALALA
jgi:hypothetical protein